MKRPQQPAPNNEPLRYRVRIVPLNYMVVDSSTTLAGAIKAAERYSKYDRVIHDAHNDVYTELAGKATK
jgi:hypothetical protein